MSRLYFDTLTPSHTCSKIQTLQILPAHVSQKCCMSDKQYSSSPNAAWDTYSESALFA